MDQHPVPQNISSYEFRLVGDMTLKQFLQLAGGCIAGLVFYRLPLPFFIKYPLIFFSVLIGILMAFVPIQGRPFTQWVMAFMRAVYSPTEFFWKPTIASTTQSPPTAKTRAEGENLGGETLPKQGGAVQTPPVVVPPTPPPQPPIVQPAATPLSPLDVAQIKVPVAAPSVPTPTQTAYVQAAAAPPSPASPAVLPAEALAKAGASAPIPTSTPIPTITPPPVAQLTNVPLTPIVPHTPTPAITRQGEVGTDLPPPSSPNILSGQVITFDSQSIEGAIVEIVDTATGIPVRALRTNRAGLFQIATPLPASTYSIYTDKENFSFEPVSVAAEGKIISPIIIRAKDHA